MNVALVANGWVHEPVLVWLMYRVNYWHGNLALLLIRDSAVKN